MLRGEDICLRPWQVRDPVVEGWGAKSEVLDRPDAADNAMDDASLDEQHLARTQRRPGVCDDQIKLSLDQQVDLVGPGVGVQIVIRPWGLDGTAPHAAQVVAALSG